MAKQITQQVKDAADGAFVDLPLGFTHYKMEGDAGEWCVLVHGYATPLFIYDKIAAGLLAAGYRVLRYDLFGRGLSQRLKTDYTPALFAEQLYQLVTALIPDQTFYLFGTSMGGSITTTFVAAHSQLVKKLVLYAPAGMVFDAPLYMKMARLPVLGECMFYTLGGPILTKGCAKELIYSSQEVAADYRAQFASYVKYSGTLRATLSSLRHTILAFDETKKGYDGTRESGIPVLVVWGTADKTMPYYQAERMQQALPDMRLVTYEGSGHVFLYDEGDRTLQTTLPFLAE